jgi:uncharacterized repeat protein (TIGR03803 family)
MHCARRFPCALIVLALLVILTSIGHAATEIDLHTFISSPQGYSPQAGLIQDAAGNLYGTTARGGAHDLGSVFEFIPNTQGGYAEKVLHSFDNSDGFVPVASLVMDSAGNLYGTTELGGSAGLGVVFELSPNSDGTWTETVLHSFAGGTDGSQPMCQLALDSSGNLYGTTTDEGYSTFGEVFELTPGSSGWTETVIYHFRGKTDGATPHGGLVVDAQGDLFGTTQTGGSGDGTVFKLHFSGSAWMETTLHSFTGTDGDSPLDTLTLDQQGNLWGTAVGGGQAGEGTVFELSLQAGKWVETTIYSFHKGGDGNAPWGGVIIDSAGNLYGTTSAGGGVTTCNSSAQLAGCGTAFELTPNSDGTWTEKILHTFGSGHDGAMPLGGVILGNQGQLLGTTSIGGSFTSGSVFQLNPSSQGRWPEVVIGSFPNRDGSGSRSPLMFDSAGNLYGTTYDGGTADCSLNQEIGCGTVFELTPKSGGGWRYALLYSFKGRGDGANPWAAVTVDSAGNLYGTTANGGTGSCALGVVVQGCGTVFELSPPSRQGGQWTEKVLYSFAGKTDGSNPSAAVVFDANGNLYGTTTGTEGGTEANLGTTFELSPGTNGQWTETVLHAFSGPDGEYSSSTLLFDSAGNLYGTASGSSVAEGNVFELSPNAGGSWTLNVLYNFQGASDLGCPGAGVIFDAAGNLYGTGACGGSIYGGVFELSPGLNGQWTENTLLTLKKTDGEYPYGALVFDSSGNLYGTAYQGGNFTACSVGCGTLYELSPGAGGTWTESIVHTFNGGLDGSSVFAGPIANSIGNLYGTTSADGNGNEGIVYEIKLH